MAETDKSGAPAPENTPNPQNEQINQLKGEFNRKLTDTNKILEQLSATNAQLTQKLDSIVNPRPKAPDTSLEKLMYTDPAAYTKAVKDQAKQEALETMRAENQGQGAVNTVIANLAAEYPELASTDSELTKASVEIIKAASAMQQKDPSFYEYAVLKAAQGLDVKPKSKRPKIEDDFQPASYSSPQGRGKRQSEDAVIKEGRDSAKAFGLDLDNPKTKARYIAIMKQKGLA